MPFDPSIPFKVDLPEPHRPIERYLTLRDMMDQRRVRESQMRRLEMQEQEDIREQEEYNRFRQALPSLTPESSLTDWITAGGPRHGVAGFKAQQDALKAQRDATESAGKAEKENLEAALKRDLLYANKAEGYLWQDDPSERKRMWDTDTPDFLQLGLITPEQAAAPQFDDEYLESIVARGKGREYLVKLQGDREKRKEEKAAASRKELQEQLQLTGRVLGFVKTPEDWKKVQPTLPAAVRTLFPADVTPEELPAVVQQATAMTMTPAERQAAMPKTLAEWQSLAVSPATSPAEKKIADQMVATLGAGQAAGIEGKIRDDFRSDPDVKNYIVRRNAWSEVQGAMQSEGGISDIKLIFNYIRMQDPTSTVRESEASMVSTAAGISDQLANLVKRVWAGNKLPPEVRADILRESGKTFVTADGDYQKKVKQFGEIADRNRVDRRNVLIDYTSTPVAPAGPAAGEQQPAASPAPAPGQPAAAAPGGIPSPIMKPGTVLVKAPDGNTYSFDSAAKAEAFKKRAGIK